MIFGNEFWLILFHEYISQKLFAEWEGWSSNDPKIISILLCVFQLIEIIEGSNSESTLKQHPSNRKYRDDHCSRTCTDKKENQIFLLYKEIQNGAVAKSYIIWLTASSYIHLSISSYIMKPFLIYDFATAPLWISLYMRKIWFSVLSVCHRHRGFLSSRPHWDPPPLHPQAIVSLPPLVGGGEGQTR